MLFVVKDLDLYGDEMINAQSNAVEMQTIPRPTIETAIDGKISHILFFSVIIFILQFFLDISPAVESNQPLLPPTTTQSATTSSQNTRPTISAPLKMTTSSTVPDESIALTEAKPTMSHSSGAIPKSKSPVALRYSPVYKQPENHIEELNLRLKSINERIHIKLTECDRNGSILNAQAMRGDDINPSIGSDTEKEIDLNIQHLESTVSSISPLPSTSSTAVNSPDAAANRRIHYKDWHAERYETDF